MYVDCFFPHFFSLEILQGQLERKEGAMATIETEISELDELIPDIDSKVL